MLARVKEELFKLIDMLTGELGFAKRDLRINFSGGRGYHVHLPLLSVRGWDTAERRELVNYVSGTGLSFDSMMESSQKSGWKLRYYDALDDELVRIAGLPAEDALSYLSGLSGISETFAAGFLKNIGQTQKLLRSNPEKLLANKVVLAIANSENEPFQAGVLSRAAQADEPVTTDVKRLIRHPGSLHGGSGMRVVPITIDQLDAFDPLIDAVVFGERNVSVDCAFNLSMPILGNTYTLTTGRNLVPEALGVFLCCRGIAELSGGI
jgi:DNA primase small subunit